MGSYALEVDLPYPSVKIKGKDRLLSANVYRNSHYLTLSKAKLEYAKVCEKVLQGAKPLTTPIHITYTLYFKGARRRDLDNFAYPVMKFFNDELTKHELIPDDNYEFIPHYDVKYGGPAEDNYVTITIQEGGDNEYIY